MNIIAFIPARSGSKSIPDKNIKLLGGKPLLVWSIESAFNAGLDRVIVNTNSDEYAKIAYENGAEVTKRADNLAKDNTSMFEMLKSEIFKIKPLPDLVLLLQPTSPLRKSIHIKSAISYLQENLEKYDSIISVEKVPEKFNPAQMIVSSSNGKQMVLGRVKSWFKKPKLILSGVPISQRITRRQEFPDAFLPDGAIYLFKTENLKKGSIYGDNVMLLETEGTININELSDWEIAEKILKDKNV